MASCGPILISYITGRKKNLPESVKVYISFSLARISVYLILSLIIFFFGRFTLESLLGESFRYILIIGGGFIALVGVLMILSRRLEFYKGANFLEQFILKRDTKSVILFGLTVGLLPCAPLAAMLSYTGLVSKSWIDSLLYSASFGAGTFFSPLVLLAVVAGYIPKFLINKQPIYSRIISLICSLIIVFFGIQLILGGL